MSAAPTVIRHDEDRSRFDDEWRQWHQDHERVRADRHGFLAITSLNWLGATPERFADAPGTWSTGPAGVVVDLDPDDELTIDGRTVRGRHEFGVLDERQSVYATWNDALLEIAKRGGYDILRPRHPDAALLGAYAGTSAFEPDPSWVAVGDFRAFDAPRPTTVGAAVDGLQHVYDAPGEIGFRLGGQELTVTAFPGSAVGTLLVLFTDETSGVTTYAANRALAVGPPAADGTVVLDFNRAVNLPCAYTVHATCPLPPRENRLPIAVEAGERSPDTPAL